MKTSVKKAACWFGIPLLVFLVLCAVIFWDPKATRLFIRMIAPPKDLYKPLIDEPCDVERSGVGRFMFENKYAGGHEVGLLLNGSTGDQLLKPLSERYVLQLRMKVTFYVKNTVVLSRVVGNSYSPFSEANANGITFFSYICPEDLPLNEVVVCEVRIIEPDSALAKSCNPVRFYICKTSDK